MGTEFTFIRVRPKELRHPDKEALESLIKRGKGAYKRIKDGTEATKEDWLDVAFGLEAGAALVDGLRRGSRYNTWCKENGFDMPHKAREDALWMAHEADTIWLRREGGPYINPALAHPSDIRKAWMLQHLKYHGVYRARIEWREGPEYVDRRIQELEEQVLVRTGNPPVLGP